MAKKDVIERCNKYLNDNLNMVESFEKLTEDFTFDITILDQKNAKSIVEEYTDYVMMLRSTYRDYRFNVENFERYVLRLNSVISSSLTLEYRINDIKTKNILMAQLAIDVIEEEIKDMKEKTNTSLNLDNFKSKLNKSAMKVIEERTNKEINKMKEDYYFIGNISKDKDLKELLIQICNIYIENELIREVREEIYKKHKIVIKNESKNKIHCLKMGAYGITSDKIEKILLLSAQNYYKVVIDNETLNLFNIFLNFKKESKEPEYKEIFNKYKKEAVKEIEAKKSKYFTFEDMIKDYTITILKELRWYINE